MAEPNSHIPTNEEEMNRVKEGDLVLLTAGDSPVWALFDGNNDGLDSFLVPSREENNDKIVSLYAQKRELHGYDKQFGVVIFTTKCGNEFERFNYNPTFPGYLEKVEKLKKAGLWPALNLVTGVKA